MIKNNNNIYLLECKKVEDLNLNELFYLNNKIYKVKEFNRIMKNIIGEEIQTKKEIRLTPDLIVIIQLPNDKINS